jgi:hypothetical protein
MSFQNFITENTKLWTQEEIDILIELAPSRAVYGGSLLDIEIGNELKRRCQLAGLPEAGEGKYAGKSISNEYGRLEKDPIFGPRLSQLRLGKAFEVQMTQGSQGGGDIGSRESNLIHWAEKEQQILDELLSERCNTSYKPLTVKQIAARMNADERLIVPETGKRPRQYTEGSIQNRIRLTGRKQLPREQITSAQVVANSVQRSFAPDMRSTNPQGKSEKHSNAIFSKSSWGRQQAVQRNNGAHSSSGLGLGQAARVDAQNSAVPGHSLPSAQPHPSFPNPSPSQQEMFDWRDDELKMLLHFAANRHPHGGNFSDQAIADFMNEVKKKALHKALHKARDQPYTSATIAAAYKYM